MTKFERAREREVFEHLFVHYLQRQQQQQSLHIPAVFFSFHQYRLTTSLCTL